MNQIRPTDLHIDNVKTETAFVDLAREWNAIADRTDSPSVFLTHEWFTAAWAWRRLHGELAVLVARRGAAMIGILPLLAIKARSEGARRLELLTVPDTQTTDLIVAHDTRDEVAQAIAHALADRRDWDVLHLDYLSPQGNCMQTLVPAFERAGFHVALSAGSRNTYVDLSTTWTDYYNTRSRKLKKANNLATNRLKKLGELRVQWLDARSSDGDALQVALDTAIAISARSWKQTTGNALDQPGPQAFIRALSKAAIERQWLSIWLMFLDNVPLAMEYQLIDGGNVRALRADFDASCDEISPGSYLFRSLLESSFGLGLRRYYMGPGENAYKLRWTEQGEPTHRAIVYNRTSRGRIAWLINAVVKPRLRDLRHRFTAGAVRPPPSGDDKHDPDA
jgi:CelD/BcsL family acetyltransferase involved in cellulose biosynthesis